MELKTKPDFLAVPSAVEIPIDICAIVFLEELDCSDRVQEVLWVKI